MGLAYYFYVQKQTAQGWVVPAGFVTCKDEGRESGEFTWIDDRDVVRELFWGDRALFPMRRDPPPDIANTSLFRRCGRAFAEWFHGWLPFEELLLDLWDREELLVSKRVQARCAGLFGDGRQRFPRQQLLAAGLAGREIENLEDTSYYVFDAAIVDEPIDRSQGQKRFELATVAPDWLVEVTWKVNVSGFLGDWRVREFRNLRRYGRDEELRVICLLS
jgi:hypothetical protein